MADTSFKITPELAIDIIRRRRWFLLVPLCAALIVGIYLAFTLPRVYEAKTLILIESQRVPQNYVQSIVTEDTAQRINTISQQIMSRTNLEKVIHEFGLNSNAEQKPAYLEDIVGSLRERISVEVFKGGREANAFTVSFKDRDPQRVMRIANRLAAYFIDENLKNRESQAIGTSAFLEAELETMRVRLEQHEEKLKNYRKANMGELPGQLETNLRILERLQQDLVSRQQVLRDAKIRLSDLNSQTRSQEPMGVLLNGERRRDDGAPSLEQLRSQLESMQSRYTEKHPDIQAIKKQIAEFEARSDESPVDGVKVPSRIPLELRLRIADAHREIQVTESEVDNLRAQIAAYQKKVENIPKREQELLGLNRDYENIKTTYESLLNRKLEADIAVNMERKQKGEQFRIIDQARVPERPTEPDMRKLFLLSVAIGLGIGAGLALLLEFARPVFRKPDEVEEQCGLPVLASIPRLLLPKQMLLIKINNQLSIAFSVVVFGLLGILALMTVKGSEFAVDLLKGLMG
jgi:polysaccharide chain length determinant protein (PEP-CTERM system associated)